MGRTLFALYTELSIIYMVWFSWWFNLVQFLHFFEPSLWLALHNQINQIEMVKTKGRKKPIPGSSTVLRTDSWASDDAPDNPGTIPVVERLSNNKDEPIVLRRSPRPCPMEVRITRINSEQNMNLVMLTGSAGKGACESNDVKQCHNDGVQSADVQSRTSTLVLAPLGAHSQELANKSAWSWYPSNDSK